MAEAIDANARNKVFFALAPDDAAHQARHVTPYLDEGDLMRLGGFEVVLRAVAGGRAVPPVTADTQPPPEPIPGRADQLRQAARRRTGLPTKTRRELLGDAATADPDPDEQPSAPVVAATGQPVPSNFDLHPNTRGENPHEHPHEHTHGRSASAEPSGEGAPMNTPYAQVDRAAPGRWTGTD